MDTKGDQQRIEYRGYELKVERLHCPGDRIMIRSSAIRLSDGSGRRWLNEGNDSIKRKLVQLKNWVNDELALFPWRPSRH